MGVAGSFTLTIKILNREHYTQKSFVYMWYFLFAFEGITKPLYRERELNAVIYLFIYLFV